MSTGVFKSFVKFLTISLKFLYPFITIYPKRVKFSWISFQIFYSKIFINFTNWTKNLHRIFYEFFKNSQSVHEISSKLVKSGFDLHLPPNWWPISGYHSRQVAFGGSDQTLELAEKNMELGTYDITALRI